MYKLEYSEARINFYTHHGLFHADEVMAAAILRLAGHELKIHRKAKDFDKEPIEINHKRDIVIDTGRKYDPSRGLFDHHQAFLRDSDGVIASTGMVWWQYGYDAVARYTPGAEEKAVTWAADRVRDALIQPLDTWDADPNARAVLYGSDDKEYNVPHLARMVSQMNYENFRIDSEKQDTHFKNAMYFCQTVLELEIRSQVRWVKDAYRFQENVRERCEGRVLMLDKAMSWREMTHTMYPRAQFVVMPGTQSAWSVIATTTHPAVRTMIAPDGIVRPIWFAGFIHQGRWIAGCSSSKEAMDVAEASIVAPEKTNALG